MIKEMSVVNSDRIYCRSNYISTIYSSSLYVKYTDMYMLYVIRCKNGLLIQVKHSLWF